MGDSRRHRFGEVDIEVGLPHEPAFGEVELDFDSSPDVADEDPASSEGQNTRVTKKLPSLWDEDTPVPGMVHEQATRVHDMSALSASTRPPPASSEVSRDPEVEPSSGIAKLRSLYAQGDADGALEVASTMAGEVARRGPIAAAPPGGDSPDASVIVEYGEATVDDDLAAILSPPKAAAQLTLTQRQSIPRVVKAPTEIASLPIDHRGGFLLAHVDGMQTLEEILDICAMPHAEALEIIASLESLGAIVFE
jgi:hypothetical protein